MSCPELKLKQPGNFQGVDYFKWCEEKNVAPAVQPVAEGTTTFDSVARATTPNVLQILVKPSRPDKLYNVVKVKLTCPNDENLNVKLPITNLKYMTTGRDEKLAFVFTKIDPTKADWCTGNQFQLEVTCKE